MFSYITEFRKFLSNTRPDIIAVGAGGDIIVDSKTDQSDVFQLMLNYIKLNGPFIQPLVRIYLTYNFDDCIVIAKPDKLSSPL